MFSPSRLVERIELKTDFEIIPEIWRSDNDQRHVHRFGE
jgi:hypothetical protein